MLNLYANFLNLNPFTFFGVNYTNAPYRGNMIWTKEQRNQVLHGMQVARLELENNLGYYLMPTFTTGEQHTYTGTPFRLKTGYFIALGNPVSVDLDDAVPSYITEPATVTVTTTTPTTIKIYHPTTGIEIIPTSSSYVGTTLTLFVPRYALVIDDNNTATGWTYTDLTKFLSTVAVKNVTLSVPTEAMTVVNSKMGLIKPVSNTVETVLVDYQSGLLTQNYHLQNNWVSFAHAMLDIQPTEDAVVKLAWLWAKDIPKSLSAQQQNCPFGQFTGAFKAYQFSQNHRVYRASPL